MSEPIQIIMQIPCTTLTKEEVGELLGYKRNSLAGKEFPPSIDGSNNRFHSFVVHEWLIQKSQQAQQNMHTEWKKYKQKASNLTRK